MLKKLRQSQSGVSIIEFALALPVFVLAIVGGVELAWQAIARQQIQKIAATTADNAARMRGAIDETDIDEIMTAAKLNGKELEIAKRGRLIISSFQRNPTNTGDWIRWQRCMGEKKYKSKYGPEGTGLLTSTLMGLRGDSAMRPPPGVALMVAEISYDHEPLISDHYFGKQTFTYETAFIVRDRNDLGIGNVTNLSLDKILGCKQSLI